MPLRFWTGTLRSRNSRLNAGSTRNTVSCAPDAVQELLATDVALDKLGRRGISTMEAEQVPGNHHITVRNRRDENEPGTRRLLIGRTDGGRTLTLVIERTSDPTTWLIVTGGSSTGAERKILEATER